MEIVNRFPSRCRQTAPAAACQRLACLGCLSGLALCSALLAYFPHVGTSSLLLCGWHGRPFTPKVGTGLVIGLVVALGIHPLPAWPDAAGLCAPLHHRPTNGRKPCPFPSTSRPWSAACPWLSSGAALAPAVNTPSNAMAARFSYCHHSCLLDSCVAKMKPALSSSTWQPLGTCSTSDG